MSVSDETVPDSTNTPCEEVDESNNDWRETAPDSTTPLEEEGESNDEFLLETVSYLLGESFRRAVQRERTLEHIQFPITEVISAVIKRPPDEPTRYSPEVRKALNSTHDNRTADIVCAIMDDLDLNQPTVLRKLNHKHRIMTMWDTIRTLVDTVLN